MQCSVLGRLWPLQLKDTTSPLLLWIQYVSKTYFYCIQPSVLLKGMVEDWICIIYIVFVIC